MEQQPGKKISNQKRIENAVAQFCEQRQPSFENRRILAKSLRDVNQLLRQVNRQEKHINVGSQFKIPQVTKYALNMEQIPPQAFNFNMLNNSWLIKQKQNMNRKTATPRFQILNDDVDYNKKDVYKSEGQINMSIEIQEDGTLLYTTDGSFPTDKNAEFLKVQKSQRTVSLTIDQRCTLRMLARNYCKADSQLISMELIPKSSTEVRRDNTMCKHTLRMDLSATGQSDPIFL